MNPPELRSADRRELSSPTPQRPGKSLTIGSVCKQLEREVKEISISKIRYLEGQQLLPPRRATGGATVHTPARRRRAGRTLLPHRGGSRSPAAVCAAESRGGARGPRRRSRSWRRSRGI